MRERDIIVRFAGKAIASVDDLHRMLTDERSGIACEVEAIRGTELLKLRHYSAAEERIDSHNVVILVGGICGPNCRQGRLIGLIAFVRSFAGPWADKAGSGERVTSPQTANSFF